MWESMLDDCDSIPNHKFILSSLSQNVPKRALRFSSVPPPEGVGRSLIQARANPGWYKAKLSSFSTFRNIGIFSVFCTNRCF